MAVASTDEETIEALPLVPEELPGVADGACRIPLPTGSPSPGIRLVVHPKAASAAARESAPRTARLPPFLLSLRVLCIEPPWLPDTEVIVSKVCAGLPSRNLLL